MEQVHPDPAGLARLEPAEPVATAPRGGHAAARAWGTARPEILLVSGTPHLPQVTGGVEVNTHELALELAARGRSAAVFAKLSLRDGFGRAQALRGWLAGEGIRADDGLGYRVYRARRPWSGLEGLPRPRVAIVQNGNMVPIGRRLAERGIATIAYLHGLEFDQGARRWAGRAEDLPFRAYIANSQFTAGRLHARFGIAAEVIPPLFRPERYRTPGGGHLATFVNPVPEKGVDLALAMAARCPEIPFRFVKGWRLGRTAARRLERACRAAGNVELVASVRDMRPLYAETRVLLAPSQWEAETWGRVVSEAQVSGIPVLASRRGGLPESVGPGGLCLPHDAPPELWAEALRSLWFDADRHAAVARAARLHAARPLLDIDDQIARLLAVVEAVA